MPIVTKTATQGSYYSDPIVSGRNMAKSIASVVGTEYKTTPDSVTNNYTYYIPMETIGYPEWCIVIKQGKSGDFYLTVGIYMMNVSENYPDFSDKNRIAYTNRSSNTVNVSSSYSGSPITCTMISDADKDTVLFDINTTSEMHSVDEDAGRKASRILFLAKDVKENVLCGVGQGFFRFLRTKDAVKDFANAAYPTCKGRAGFNNILHLTKMVNYLSPEFPEMKSAYVSVVSPLTGRTNTTTKKILLLESNGVNWGRVGNLDYAVDRGDWEFYPPINPFVKY